MGAIDVCIWWWSFSVSMFVFEWMLSAIPILYYLTSVVSTCIFLLERLLLLGSRNEIVFPVGCYWGYISSGCRLPWGCFGCGLVSELKHFCLWFYRPLCWVFPPWLVAPFSSSCLDVLWHELHLRCLEYISGLLIPRLNLWFYCWMNSSFGWWWLCLLISWLLLCCHSNIRLLIGILFDKSCNIPGGTRIPLVLQIFQHGASWFAWCLQSLGWNRWLLHVRLNSLLSIPLLNFC